MGGDDGDGGDEVAAAPCCLLIAQHIELKVGAACPYWGLGSVLGSKLGRRREWLVGCWGLSL